MQHLGKITAVVPRTAPYYEHQQGQQPRKAITKPPFQTVTDRSAEADVNEIREPIEPSAQTSNDVTEFVEQVGEYQHLKGE